MPSSPGPTDYQRITERFFFRGMSLLPQDALPPGKAAFVRNIRSYQDGTFEPRFGLDQLTPSPVDNASPQNIIHSIFRLNDPTPFADNAVRFLGVGDQVYAGFPGVDLYTLTDAGPYSGTPLTGLVAQPVNSPRPYLYVADADRLRKFNTDFDSFSNGLPQPLSPPLAELASPEITFLDSLAVATRSPYGGAAAGYTLINRVSTTMPYILYDEGVTGMASFTLADFDNVTPGVALDIGASPETIIVHAVLPPVSPTTIAAILYDSGTNGMCTIQPTGSFSVGQIEAPLPIELERRYKNLNEPLPPRVTVTRTIDFPVDCLVVLGGTETVRIQSVAIGPDGVQSFRAQTVGTFAAGASISGIASCRGYFNTTKTAGAPVDAVAGQVTVTPASASDSTVGGIQGPITGSPLNWALVGSRAVQPEDIIRFGIRISLMGFVESVRFVINVSPDTVSPGTEFLKDYYFYEWRAPDLITAIQATGETATGLVADAQAASVIRGQTDSLYSDQYGQAPVRTGIRGVIPNPIAPVPGLPGRYPWVVASSDSGQSNTAATGPVSTGSAISRQLSLGNDAWMTLECRVGDLTRVGSDATLTLGALYDVAVYMQVKGTTDPITFDLSDIYMIGGYGPDVSTTLPPYVYRYSYRSTLTGERSNPSPSMRAGVTPKRGRVQLTLAASPEAQCDVIDIWRFGGALARWEFVGMLTNDATVSPPVNLYFDDNADKQIDGGERIRPNWYQPFPTADLPRSGTCNVAGTAVEWVSGDLFDIEWAPDSLITVNGFTTQLYTSPSSTTRLEVIDNCGSGTGVPFTLPSPTLLAQPLPAIFGGTVNSVWFHFACGDPTNPGVLHWTHGNDPDATSDRNTYVVTSASEPLQNGFIDDGIPYVFSTERLYRILPNFGGVSDFLVAETNCSRGLWSRWFLVVDPEGGCYFGNKEGIFHTAGGADAVSITDEDLKPLFPQDGSTSETIRNLNPIDFSVTTRLRLSIVGQYLYFDYVDTSGEGHTLVYDREMKAWMTDTYLETGDSPSIIPTGVTVRLSEPGEQVYDHILALEDGNLYQYAASKTTDVLNDVNWAYWTPWPNGNDPRAWKQWGDAILDFNPGGSVNGVQVTPVINNGNTALAAQLIGAGGLVRDTYLIEISSGAGQFSRNFGLWIEGAVQACDTERPVFYLWEPSFLHKSVSIARRATDWEDLGYKGAKFIQGVVLRANTFGEQKLLEVQFDGPLAAPQVAITLSIQHDGEQTIAYPVADTGWQPFVAELVRLQGIDDVSWILHDWRFVYEPAPEAATHWVTQPTTFDLPGFLSVFDGVMAYSADAEVELTVWHDLNPLVYTLPATGGEYQRIHTIFEAAKGKAVYFEWYSTLPLRLYKSDCSVRIQGWGIPGGYQIVSPFGGPHRIDGAGI